MLKKNIKLGFFLFFGIIFFSCGDDSGDCNCTTMDYNPTGTWDFLIYDEPATVIVNGNNYIFSGYGFTDAGTFNREGNTATLRTSTVGWNNAKMGTATMTSSTTMILNLVSPSLITGIYYGIKRIN